MGSSDCRDFAVSFCLVVSLLEIGFSLLSSRSCFSSKVSLAGRRASIRIGSGDDMSSGSSLLSDEEKLL